jgi:hypothetical protein
MTQGEVVPFTRPDEEIGRVALPARLADEVERDGATLEALARLVRRLDRENGRIRRRLAAVERALTDGETGAARRAELRRRP